MKRLIVGVATLALALQVASSAQACMRSHGGCGGCDGGGYVSGGCGDGGGYVGGGYGDGGCGFQQQVTYQQVTQTVYENVPVTTMQQQTVTVMTSVPRQVTQTYTVNVPVTRTVQQQYTTY